MISQLNKLRSIKRKSEISEIIKLGKYINTEYGKIILHNIDDHIPRYALLVKKYSGNAVYRNYVKRILRHYLRSKITLFERYNRVIFIYNYKNSKVNYNKLKVELDKLLSGYINSEHS